MEDIVKTRNYDNEISNGIDEYLSFCDFDRKIHIDSAYNLWFSCMIVMENMDAYRDEGMGDVIVGKPFCREICVKARWFNGMITIYNGNDGEPSRRLNQFDGMLIFENSMCIVVMLRTSAGMFLSQSKYAKELLEGTHMLHCNHCRTPVDTKSKLGPHGDLISHPTLYRSLVGGLRLAVVTSAIQLGIYSSSGTPGTGPLDRLAVVTSAIQLVPRIFIPWNLVVDLTLYSILLFSLVVLSVHNRWVVYRGDSSDSKDIIFSAKQSSLIQFKTSLDVFLGYNEKESVCDYKVKGSWFDRSCTIYAGESTHIVAQMHKKHTVQSIALGKDTFAVTVYPNVDYAFIVALVVILHEINKQKIDVE
nr:protein LURP-one-related 15 [Tanacetum cinerariifolium]